MALLHVHLGVQSGVADISVVATNLAAAKAFTWI
jgi:hypothetical protein